MQRYTDVGSDMCAVVVDFDTRMETETALCDRNFDWRCLHGHHIMHSKQGSKTADADTRTTSQRDISLSFHSTGNDCHTSRGQVVGMSGE